MAMLVITRWSISRWYIHPMAIYIYIYIYILNIVIFHSYVGLPEGKNTNHIILVGGLEHVFYFPQ